MDLPEPRWADLNGPVHWVDFGGPRDGRLLVCVHGLGGSHLNWLAVAPPLVRSCRVVALDLAGFGLTRGHRRSTSVPANRELLHRFLTEVIREPVILIGNSMGGMISLLEAAAHPDVVTGLVLIDPALPPALPPAPSAGPAPQVAVTFAAYLVPWLARLLLSRRRRTRTAEQLAMDMFQLCCVDAARVSRSVFQAHVRLAQRRRHFAEADAEFVTAARSMLRTMTGRRRYADAARRVVAPVLLLHGARDRLVPVAAARAAARAHPHWHYQEASDAGHVPQLEVPEWTAARILHWLTEISPVSSPMSN